MTDPRKQAVRDFLSASFAGDRARMGALVTNDCQVWLPQSSATAVGLASPVVGRERIVAIFDGSASPLFDNGATRLDFLHQITEDDCVGSHFRIVTRTKAGLMYENVYMVLCRLDGARIAEWWEHLDTAYAFAKFKEGSS